jgi:uncharacterized protein YecE (DUF72 family)
VKAFRLFTQHQTAPRVLPKYIAESLPVTKKTVYYKDMPAELLDALWNEFRAALLPLKEARKLGVVLFQFPPWFLANKASLAHIEQCVERMNGFRLAVEFRNETWFYERSRERTFAFERERGIAHVVVDEPQGFKSSISSVWEVTCPHMSIVRLHGRNRDTWEKRGLTAASDRFNYLSAFSLSDLIDAANSASSSSLSGVLVGPNDVLTASHIVYDGAHGGLASSIVVVPSYEPSPLQEPRF